jgi:SAM-dependent methyltransferase
MENRIGGPGIECPCGARYEETLFAYDEPPVGETSFQLAGEYRRVYNRCRLCGHCFSRHTMDMSDFYSGAYVTGTYGYHLRASYDRVMALPPERSDNAGRVARICAFADSHLRGKTRRLLDVGSGLAVFPARMREAGWDCTALDPDPRATEHAREVAGVAAVTGDFRTMDRAALGRFELVTLNKVLEHVEHPVAMLRAAAQLVEPHGFLYIEVPDGELSAMEGKGRQEFYVEHHHAFSPASLALLAARAALRARSIERLREPSAKFTLFAFLDAP